MEDRHYQILSESRKVGCEILKLFFNEFEWWRTTGRERERERERHRGSSQFGQYPDYRRLMRFLHDQTHIAIQSREYQPSALSIHNTRDTERTYWEIIFHYSDSEIPFIRRDTDRRQSDSLEYCSIFSVFPLDYNQIFLLFVIYFSIGPERQRALLILRFSEILRPIRQLAGGRDLLVMNRMMWYFPARNLQARYQLLERCVRS